MQAMESVISTEIDGSFDDIIAYSPKDCKREIRLRGGGDILQKTEIWVVKQRRIPECFQTLPDSARNESGFVFGECRIAVTAPEPHWIPALPQIQVRFAGEERSVASIHRPFLLRFLSAGG